MAENEVTQANALEPKTKLKGNITKITIGGAIVDLGMELPGVIHISQLQKEHLTRVEDAVEIGQEAVRQLLARIADPNLPRQIASIPSHVVIRESTGPASE